MPSRFISSVIDQQDKTDPKKAKADIFNFHKDSSTNLLIEHDKKEIECETEKKIHLVRRNSMPKFLVYFFLIELT